MAKVYDFLIKMAQDLDLQRAFAEDSKAVMDANGLNAQEQAAVLSGSLDKLYEVAGSGGVIICKNLTVYDPKKPPPKPKK